MTTFWHFLYLLHFGQGSANVVDPNTGHVIYGGNQLQAFTAALQLHAKFVWTQYPGWCGALWPC